MNDVGLLVDELIPLLATLEDLIPEPVQDPSTGTMSHHKISGSPAPWHPEAGMVLLTIHEEARRLEASLLREITGKLGCRRGGSDVNTAQALRAIANLAHGVPDDHASKARRIVERWLYSARQIRDVGLEERWEPIPVPPGQIKPRCPYCRTFSLRVLPSSSLVRCINRSCRDRNDDRPQGWLHRSSLNGDPRIDWTDGRVTYRRDWA